MLSRKALFLMYPNKAEVVLLEEALGLHCRLSNTFIEEHRRRYDAGEPAYNFKAMCQDITQWRKRSASLANSNAQSLQVTAKRIALAFDAFFRRVKANETPGYPRYKAVRRYPGWGYKTHGDGWKLLGSKAKLNDKRACTGYTYSSVRLSGIGTIALRGKARFFGTPKTAEVIRRHGKWYLSVTFDVEEAAVQRQSGKASMSFDWGIETLLTQVVGDALTGAVVAVDNPRWLKRKLGVLAELQKGISTLENRAKEASGKTSQFPVSASLRRCYDKLRRVHRQIAQQRQDFYHKLTTALVKTFGMISTEQLNIANMVRKPDSPPSTPAAAEQASLLKKPVPGATKKINSPALRRSTYDAAGGKLLQMLRYKAEEADTKLYEHLTKKLKPSQRCCHCGKTQKMPLDVRIYSCSCGNMMPRDENSARTVQRYTFEGAWWEKAVGMGTVPAVGLQS